ncbi:MAG: LLM class flavin-dependent oxidoreductase, partial [Pseudomonadota bacterium]
QRHQRGPVPDIHHDDRDPRRQRAIQGTPDRVAEQLLSLADAHAAQELMVICITPEYETRLRSYELLADVLLPQAAAAATQTSTAA